MSKGPLLPGALESDPLVQALLRSRHQSPTSSAMSTSPSPRPLTPMRFALPEPESATD